MKRTIWLVLMAGCLTAWAVPRGTVPRAVATQYPAHAEQDGVGVGAKLLSRDQARKAFVSDVNDCCLVVDIALYPRKDKALEVSLNDLTLRQIGSETAAKPSSAKLIAASLQKSSRAKRDISVYPSTEIGYGSGPTYDPNTGTQQRGGGVYTRTGVGVGIGSPGAGATDKDRSTMETELSEKGLPEGSAAAPVAGYVYFPIHSTKKKVSYVLSYVLNGNKVVLALPQP
jgi:hypothetical protein